MQSGESPEFDSHKCVVGVPLFFFKASIIEVFLGSRLQKHHAFYFARSTLTFQDV